MCNACWCDFLVVVWGITPSNGSKTGCGTLVGRVAVWNITHSDGEKTVVCCGTPIGVTLLLLCGVLVPVKRVMFVVERSLV